MRNPSGKLSSSLPVTDLTVHHRKDITGEESIEATSIKMKKKSVFLTAV